MGAEQTVAKTKLMSEITEWKLQNAEIKHSSAEINKSISLRNKNSEF